MTGIRLRPGAALRDLESVLLSQARAAENVVNSFGGLHPKDYLTEYLSWIDDASKMLRNQLHRAQVEQLLHTRHYWVLRQMDGTEPFLSGQIKGELIARRDALTELSGEAKKLALRWNVTGVIVVPDTNVLLHTTEFFDEMDWATALAIDEPIHLVIPMVVVDQLDSLKRSTQAVRTRARQTGKRLEELLGNRDWVVLRRTEPAGPIDSRGQPVTTLQVLADPLDHTRLLDADSEIVDRAMYLRDLTGLPLRIVTWDNLMRFRAGPAGVETVELPPEYEQPDDPPARSRTPRRPARAAPPAAAGSP